MKWLIALFCSPCFAQYSMVEGDAGNRFKVLGKSWQPSFFSLASVENDKVGEEGGRFSTYNYFTFSTWVGENLRFKFRVPFTYASAGTDRFNGGKQNAQEFAIQDMILSLQSSDFWLLPFDIGQYWEARAYVPNSSFSKQSGKITTLRNEFIFTKMFTRAAGVEYDQKAIYHVQSRSAYATHFTDENGFDVDTTALTKKMELDHWVNAIYKLTNAVSVGWKIGWEDTWWNKSAELGKSKPAEHLVKTGPSVRYSFSRSASFLLAYEDKVDAEENRAEFGRFLAKNSSLVLLSFISF